MDEIRSTLDIIMEKTKDLTMSDEEKEEFRKKELTGKVKGLVQKFLDDFINFKVIRSGIESEREKDPLQANELLKEELIERLEPDGNNDKIFQLLEELLDIDTSPLNQSIAEFQKRVTKEKDIKTEGLRKKLAERAISGTAVVPNLAIDATWNSFYEETKRSCKEQLGVIAGSQTIGPQSS